MFCCRRMLCCCWYAVVSPGLVVPAVCVTRYAVMMVNAVFRRPRSITAEKLPSGSLIVGVSTLDVVLPVTIVAVPPGL